MKKPRENLFSEYNPRGWLEPIGNNGHELLSLSLYSITYEHGLPHQLLTERMVSRKDYEDLDQPMTKYELFPRIANFLSLAR